ncbi:MAG: bifunctional (p)ppGpp synthetase/guanosine-3',5'-bis(diphosphate) 3'-pyrophosphohydrolase [Gammaproteobacteria bacterium]|nr:bifunctional (p)ppGpp synthetase/guanosine-3',5'-bis(diphosphate) 3'-pyrophosphohydrolase [Gammaproteobacteria bacterium]
MVQAMTNLPRLDDHSIDINRWLGELSVKAGAESLLRQACTLSRVTEDQMLFYGESCFSLGLEMASQVAAFYLDPELLAAAIVYGGVEYGDLKLEDVEEQLGAKVAKMVHSTQKMSALTTLRAKGDHKQIDNLRRMLLALVSDVRIVLIKLAERLCIMRAVKHSDDALKKEMANETMAIYAPLANRLGIHQFKWELEDISFRYLHAETYKKIAKQLQQRRVEREQNINAIIEALQTLLGKAGIKAEVYGRAKHIYSIYRKMMRKGVDFSRIYDAHAVRILVNNVDECYQVLSIAHQAWPAIAEEFDDYIHSPKPNGYQSIHTAVVGPGEKSFEIQIRTHQMHEDAEKGVAAHWIYKEGSSAQDDSYEQKVAWLRQLLEWQKEMVHEEQFSSELENRIFEDRVYVFTPGGEIVDMPQGATPLDFAYAIHTEVGHRCRGVKVNGRMVPLTYALHTGECVEVLTGKSGGPSRDWLVPQRGYLQTSRARAKVLHWFKQQEIDRHIEEARSLLEREWQRLGIESVSLDKVANKLNYKTVDSMLASLGSGDLRISAIVNQVERQKRGDQPAPIAEEKPVPLKTRQIDQGKGDVLIYGVGDMLTRIAKCCKPVPGDLIVGYLTRGFGVSVHHQQCKNIPAEGSNGENRLIEVEWRYKNQQYYLVDIHVNAYDRPGLVRDVSHALANQGISITRLNTHLNKTNGLAYVELTIEVVDLSELDKILQHIEQLPNVYEVKRDSSG